MATIPSYVPLTANSAIVPQPVNINFEQVYNLLNVQNSDGLDYANIGSAGLNASLFTGGFVMNSFLSGTSTFYDSTFKATKFSGTALVGSVAQTLSNSVSFPVGSIAFGRPGPTRAVLWMGGNASYTYMDWNQFGNKELSIYSGAVCGYKGAVGIGRMIPMYNQSGNDLGMARMLVGTRAYLAPLYPPYSIPLLNNTAYGNSTSFLGFTSSPYQNFIAGQLFMCTTNVTQPDGAHASIASNTGPVVVVSVLLIGA